MTYFLSGSHNFICDVCGFKFKSTEKKRRWDGLVVCPDDYEVDHPQKYIRVQPDGQPVQDPRPEPEDTFIYVCDLWSSSPMADFGEANCATVGGHTSITLLIENFRPAAIAGVAVAGRSLPGVF